MIGAATAAVVALDADPGSPLFRVADPSRVGVAGPSTQPIRRCRPKGTRTRVPGAMSVLVR